MKSKSVILSVLVLLALAICTTLMAVPQWDRQSLTPSDISYLEMYRGMTDEQAVAKAWVHVCGRNRALYPDLNLVRPGDAILLPLAKDVYVAQAGGRDCMWEAAKYYVATTVKPYLTGMLIQPTPPKPETVKVEVPVTVPADTSWWEKHWYLWPIAMVIFWLLWRANRRKPEPEEEPTYAFDDYPPDYATADNEEVREAVQDSIDQSLGRNFEVLDTVRGRINGTQRVFFSNGTCRDEEFENAEGVCATVRDKKTGRIRKVYCLWACLNPLASSIDSDFQGTFTPEGEFQTADVIPRISVDQVDAFNRHIRSGETNLSIDDLPGNDLPEPKKEVTPDTETATTEVPATTTTASAPDPEHQLVRIKNCQISKGRMTLGDFEGTPAQLDKVLDTLSRHAQSLDDSKPAADTPAKKEE